MDKPLTDCRPWLRLPLKRQRWTPIHLLFHLLFGLRAKTIRNRATPGHFSVLLLHSSLVVRPQAHVPYHIRHSSTYIHSASFIDYVKRLCYSGGPSNSQRLLMFFSIVSFITRLFGSSMACLTLICALLLLLWRKIAATLEYKREQKSWLVHQQATSPSFHPDPLSTTTTMKFSAAFIGLLASLSFAAAQDPIVTTVVPVNTPKEFEQYKMCEAATKADNGQTVRYYSLICRCSWQAISDNIILIFHSSLPCATDTTVHRSLSSMASVSLSATRITILSPQRCSASPLPALFTSKQPASRTLFRCTQLPFCLFQESWLHWGGYPAVYWFPHRQWCSPSGIPSCRGLRGVGRSQCIVHTKQDYLRVVCRIGTKGLPD